MRRIKVKGCRGNTVTTQKSPAVQEGSEMCKCDVPREENKVWLTTAVPEKTQTTLTKVPKPHLKPKPLDRKNFKPSNQPIENSTHTELSSKEREQEGGLCFRLTSCIF